MHHGPIGIDEHRQLDLFLAFARRDFAAAFAEPKFLLERRACRERIGRERDANLAELHQPRDFAQRIGAADVKLQIAVFLDPEVQSDLAVAQRHRAGGVLAGRRPDDVARFQIGRRGRFRGACRCDSKAERESASGKF